MTGPSTVSRVGRLMVMLVATAAVTQAHGRPLERHFGSENSCYQRIYSGDHLDKHTGQRVTSLRFDHFPTTFGTYDANNRIAFDPATADLYFTVSATFRGSGKKFTNSGICTPAGQIYRCQIECDGGGFTLKDKSATSILVINESGFAVSGCDAGEHRLLEPEPDDKVFRLDRLAAGSCTPPNR